MVARCLWGGCHRRMTRVLALSHAAAPCFDRSVKRREFLALPAALLAAETTRSLGASPGVQVSSRSPTDIIDCHTHFYDPTRPDGVPWPGKNTPLYRRVLPADLRALPKLRPVTGTVIVEASAWLEDNQWLLDLAKDDPFVVGVVGRLSPGEPGFAENARRFVQNPLYRGIRISSKVLRGLLEGGQLGDLQLLADLDLSLDVNGGPEVLPLAGRVGSLVPRLRVVVNHIGNVEVTASEPPEVWREGIRLAAAQPNVFCKISALVEGASRSGGKAPSDPGFYVPYIDVVWGAFGEDRVIYGSNWPVSESAADYATLQRIALDYATSKGDAALQKFCAANAGRAYKWVERPGRLG